MTTCERCGRAVVTVDSIVGDRHLTMHSCSRCDLRTWQRDGEVIDIDDVLDLTAAQAERLRPNKSG